MQSTDFETLTETESMSLRLALTPAARQEVLFFIRQQFMAHYGALVHDDAPTLLGAFDAEGTLIAAFGLRRAEDGFFCERYIGRRVELELANRYQQGVDVREVVEVVHLCAVRPGFLVQLMPVLARSLEDLGFRFLVCTATGCLASFFGRKGLPAVHLAAADPLSLAPAERQRWGSYYDKHPEVIAGDLGVALGLLAPVARLAAASGA
jgi:hypothetical protein